MQDAVKGSTALLAAAPDSAATLPPQRQLPDHPPQRRVVAFEPQKIAVALIKAFLAVLGAQGAAFGQRARQPSTN